MIIYSRGLPLLLALLLAGCTTPKPLPTQVNLTGRDEPCEVVLANLKTASEKHNKVRSSNKWTSGTGEVIAGVTSVVTFGATGLAYIIYDSVSGDGGVEEARLEWEQWNNIAWMKGCKA